MNRREFLKKTIFAGFGLGLYPYLEVFGQGKKQKQPSDLEQKYDVSFFWDDDIDSIIQYRDELATELGPELSEQMRVVRGKNNFGLIYKRQGTKESVKKTVNGLNKKLKQEGLESCIAIKDESFEEMYSIGYGGRTKSFGSAKKTYAYVTKMLGSDVGKELFIEQIDDDYRVVYQRANDKESTQNVAKKHQTLLKGVRAEAFPIDGSRVIFGQTFNQEEEDDAEPESKKMPKAAPKIVPKTSPKKSIERLDDVVDKIVKRNRRAFKALEKTKTSFWAYDFTSGESILSINSEVPMQSASMVKPLVALAYFTLVEKGKLSYSENDKKDMESMIRFSSNKATNRLFQRVGGPRKVNRTLKENYPNMFKETTIVENIPNEGRTYKNKSSARDYSRFLFALWDNKLPYSKEMKRLMALPNLDRIYYKVPEIPYDTKVYDKTGTTGLLVGNMGILSPKGKDGKRYPYMMIGIVERESKYPSFGEWKRVAGNTIRKVSAEVYETMEKRHDLR